MLNDIFLLIINTVVSILGGAMLLRFWMQAIQVRPPYALGDFLFKLTNWLVKPLRKVLPGTGGYDWASIIGAFLVYAVAAALMLFLLTGQVAPQVVVMFALMRLVQAICYGFIILLIIGAILSWVNPHAPAAPFIYALNAPLLRPIRKFLPPMGGIDLSPLVAIVVLQIVLMVVVRLLAQF